MNRTRTSGPSTLSIWAAMLAVYIVWGSTYLAIHFSIQTMPPFLMAGVRFLIAGTILYVWRMLAGDRAPTAKQWRSSAVVGTLLLLGGNGCVVWAEQRVPSGIAALMVGSSPLWMVLYDMLRNRNKRGARRPGWITILGVVLGFAGIAVLVTPGDLTGLHGAVDPLGAGLLTLAAILWASGSLFSRNADLPGSPLLGTAMEMLCGGVGLTLAGTITGEWSTLNIGAISTNSLLGWGYLIFIGSLVGYSAYTWLLRVAPTTLVSTYAYVNPVVAIFIGNLLAAEPLTPRVIIATLVIVGAVALITFTQPLSAKSIHAETTAATASDD
jgi:drug/metabolite transporter (DMT)-like permease